MNEEKDGTNWNAWYIGLIAVLLVQILVYLWITNTYAA
jgi:hypothetical protein